MRVKRWIFRSVHGAVIVDEQQSRSNWLDILLKNRGIESPQARSAFMHSDFEDLSPPFALLNMGPAVERIRQALEKNERICIYGDYDVDGMSAVALMRRCFRFLGHDTSYYIPDRLQEGYGMNSQALTALQHEGVDLIITVDNGIAAASLIEAFPEMDFIVTDHHQPSEELPDAIILNPQLDQEEKLPFKHLSGAGVAFFLARALLESLQPKTARKRCFELLDLVALATVADVVPLTGDNRILVKLGLKEMNQLPEPYLQALWPGIEEGKELEASHIAFQIAPRINACGRLGQADQGLALLEAKEKEEAQRAAFQANALNEERKELESQIYCEALMQLEREAPAFLVWGSNWHEGVIGIVASRLVERTGRPVAVCCLNEEGELTCSARSIPGVHLSDGLAELSKLLTAHGGHAMAAGFRLREENREAFETAFQNYCARELKGVDPRPVCAIDAKLTPEAIDNELYAALQSLAPYGEGNPEPLFLIERARPLSSRRVGQEGAHMILEIAESSGKPFKTVYFRYPQERPLPQGPIDLIGRVSVNRFRGMESLEMHLEDIRPAWMSADANVNDFLFRPRSSLPLPLRQGSQLSVEKKEIFVFPYADAAFRAYGVGAKGRVFLKAQDSMEQRQALLGDIQKGNYHQLFMSIPMETHLESQGFLALEAFQTHHEEAGMPAVSIRVRSEAPQEALLQALKAPGWQMIYMTEEAECLFHLKRIRAALPYEKRDRALWLPPALQAKDCDMLRKHLLTEKSGLLLACRRSPLCLQDPLFEEILFWDLPESQASLAAWALLLSEGGTVSFLEDSRRGRRQEKDMKQRFPDRELLGRFYQSLRQRIGSYERPIAWGRDFPAELSQLAGEQLTPKFLELGCRIFQEIDLLDVAKDGDVRYIKLIRAKEKRDLTDSVLFAEGDANRKAFESLQTALYHVLER